jgi:hypothetical protein
MVFRLVEGLMRVYDLGTEGHATEDYGSHPRPGHGRIVTQWTSGSQGRVGHTNLYDVH